jgi:hypothetical protein
MNTTLLDDLQKNILLRNTMHPQKRKPIMKSQPIIPLNITQLDDPPISMNTRRKRLLMKSLVITPLSIT